MGSTLFNDFDIMEIENNISIPNNKIFIRGNVPSSKNSRIWTGRFSIVSKTVTKYLKAYEYQFEEKRNEFLKMNFGKSYPLHIKFRFVRDSKRLFDLINAAQIVQDMMVKHQWIGDDNYTWLIPSFDPNVTIDKLNPGVEIISL